MDSNKYGRVEEHGAYKDGLKEGPWLRYDFKRGLVYIEKYEAGKRKGKKSVGRINHKTLPTPKLDEYDKILKKLS